MRIEVPHRQFRLPNGLNVILHEDRSVPLVAVNLWYHVGSSHEKAGRTGLAHLFEHLMFEGSKNVPEGEFDNLLESAGGHNNGTTDEDRTNYFELLPSHGLELALFLESDRMGYLLDALTQEKLDAQREVVKNERRQSYDNRPYGPAELELPSLVFPPGHPYHWPVIGSMEDLSAAGFEDVTEFFKEHYGPGNASLAVAGDLDFDHAERLVEKWFSEIPGGKPLSPLEAPPARISGEILRVMEDRVQLPRLYLAWTTPAHLEPGDAELDLLADILTEGKSSRLFRRLVYDMEIAQNVAAYQYSRRLASLFVIQVTARAGLHLDRVLEVVEEELQRLREEGPARRELERAVHQAESSFLEDLERVSRKADFLNGYFFYTGVPDYFDEDLSRYRAVSPRDVQDVMARCLIPDRVVLSVVPERRGELAVGGVTTPAVEHLPAARSGDTSER